MSWMGRMDRSMRTVWVLLIGTLIALSAVVVVWLLQRPGPQDPNGHTPPPTATQPVLRIGLIPERDVFEQRRRYRALADYLAGPLGGPVELVTVNTYEGILQDFAEQKIDAAFLGSLVAALAMDRIGARVVVKPELPGGVSTYHGVIFVRADSPIQRLEDLPGHSLGMVRTTTAGHAFSGCVLMRLKLFGRPDCPRSTWIGTHDDVVRQVIDGQIDAGAVKNLRLDAMLRANPDWRIRPLARSRCVPSNGLLVREDVSVEFSAKLADILTGMTDSPKGRQTLAALGATRFVPCQPLEYAPVYDMTECIAPAWKEIGVPGPIPVRPSDWPKPAPIEERECYDVNY